MTDPQKVSASFLGEEVTTASGETAILASIDCDGVCVLEYADGRQDVTGWQNLPIVAMLIDNPNPFE